MYEVHMHLVICTRITNCNRLLTLNSEVARFRFVHENCVKVALNVALLSTSEHFWAHSNTLNFKVWRLRVTEIEFQSILSFDETKATGTLCTNKPCKRTRCNVCTKQDSWTELAIKITLKKCGFRNVRTYALNEINESTATVRFIMQNRSVDGSQWKVLSGKQCH